MNIIVRQPLFHFLLLGSLMFLAYGYMAAPPVTANTGKNILVDRSALLNFMQYREQSFNEQYYVQQLEAMDQTERQRLIDELVREEALYREALAMQLDEDDYVIKRRLIQKMEFLTSGFITAGSSLSAAEVNIYYAGHKQEYYAQPHVTFTHVFFDHERHAPEQMQRLAEETLGSLNDRQVSFDQATKYGDRFLYHANYVERTPDYVAAHFGEAAAGVIFELSPDERRWYGPITSSYGLHLIMLTKKEPGRYPELGEIYDRVSADAGQAAVQAKTEAAIAEIINTYEVKVDVD